MGPAGELEITSRLLSVCRRTVVSARGRYGDEVPFAVMIDAAGEYGSIHAGDDMLTPKDQVAAIGAKLRAADLTKYAAIALVWPTMKPDGSRFIAIQVENADTAIAHAYPYRYRFLGGWRVDDVGEQMSKPIAPLVWAKQFNSGTETQPSKREPSHGRS